jgi:hypothetical protein
VDIQLGGTFPDHRRLYGVIRPPPHTKIEGQTVFMVEAKQAGISRFATYRRVAC